MSSTFASRWRVALAAACAAVAAGALSGAAIAAPQQDRAGKVVWLDLATEDPAASRAFYGAVFGWTVAPARSGAAGASVLRDSAGAVGGLILQARPAGAKVGARWLSYLAVPDAQAAARRVQQDGGRVLVAPETDAGRTRAVLRDPEGAVFGVLASAQGDPPDAPVTAGRVFWLDLFSRDPARAARFYAGVAGYAVTEHEAVGGARRLLLASGGYARAGVLALRAPDAQPGWLPYFLVDDVPATLSRALAAGGRVVLAPRAELLGGKVAVLADPLGGVFGIVDWDERVAAPGERR